MASESQGTFSNADYHEIKKKFIRKMSKVKFLQNIENCQGTIIQIFGGNPVNLDIYYFVKHLQFLGLMFVQL